MYSFVKRLLTDQGIPCDIFLYERPRFFDVLCNIQQSTGEVKATAFYLVRLYEQFYGIPVLTRKIASFNTKRGWPDYEPNISFQMRNENEFTAMVNVLEEQEIIAEENVSVEERKTLLFTMKTCPNCKVAEFMLD